MFLTIAKVRYVTARRSVEIENARGGGGGLEYNITKRRPLKLVGRKKWGTHDALHANKAVPPLSVLFDLKT